MSWAVLLHFCNQDLENHLSILLITCRCRYHSTDPLHFQVHNMEKCQYISTRRHLAQMLDQRLFLLYFLNHSENSQMESSFHFINVFINLMVYKRLLPGCTTLKMLKQNEISTSVQFSHSVVSDSLQPHESQHTSPPCPSPTPGVHSDSRPSSQ